MIASSAFVLAALTMTGVYMKDKSDQSKDDGYSIDFSELENNVDNKYNEIVQNNQTDQQIQPEADMGQDVMEGVPDSDLDYLPMEEAGSNLVEIPGLTDGINEEADGQMGSGAPDAEGVEEQDIEQQDSGQTAGGNVTVTKELHFSEEQGLVRPSAGSVLIPYSMESSIYFATLDQYKYNPAVIISAAEGETVSACAEGKVLSIFENEEIGKAVTLDLGDGYQATYGQLKDILVSEGSYINPGEALGSVANATKYYSVEGTNLYFQLTKDGSPVNPEGLFR